MNTATPQRTAPRPIKGSWEDLFSQAQQLASNYNDEAIAIYQRVFNGLMALPAAAREAGERRLFNLMMATGVELQGYLNLRDRYDESLAVIDKLSSLVPADERSQFIELKSDVLLQAERGEEAIALLRELATTDEADAADWGQIIAAYIRLKQPEKALEVVDEFSAWIDAQKAASAFKGEQASEAQYYERRLRAAALLELGRIEEATAIFDEVYAQGGADAFSPHLIYTRFVQRGMYEQALRYIDRDQAHPVRAAFWRGLVQRYMGAESKATRTWEAAISEGNLQQDQSSIVEHVLSRFYLGDPRGEGMEILLRAQREQQQRVSWMLFFLTGLGWIVRGDYNAAHSNIKLAVAQVKSVGEGKTLSNHYWRFVKDLTPADHVAQFAQYFDTSDDVVTSNEVPDTMASDTVASDTTASDTTASDTTVVEPTTPDSDTSGTAE